MEKNLLSRRHRRLSRLGGGDAATRRFVCADGPDRALRAACQPGGPRARAGALRASARSRRRARARPRAECPELRLLAHVDAELLALLVEVAAFEAQAAGGV